MFREKLQGWKLHFYVCVCVCERWSVFVFPRALVPPPAVDGCCDRQQRLTGRRKAAPRPPRRPPVASSIASCIKLELSVSQSAPTTLHHTAAGKHGGGKRRRSGNVGSFDEISYGFFKINCSVLHEVSAHLQQVNSCAAAFRPNSLSADFLPQLHYEVGAFVPN